MNLNISVPNLNISVPRYRARGHAIGYALSLFVAAVAIGVNAPAHAGLVIDATFAPSIASVSGAETAIDAAIATLETDISSPNNITVSIYFNNMSSGLGESLTGIYALSYFNYYNALAAVATQPDQLTALASLGGAPGAGSPNPVNGTPNVIVTSAEGRNLGFNTPGGVAVGSGTYDTEISLNTSITSPPNGLSGNYGLESVAEHELDEALGIGGTGSMIGGTGFFATGVGDLDLYRYTAPGVRSYSTTHTTSPYSYFSIDGGNTVLSYFNQTGGADYGDWLSNPIPVGFSPQVQDAFGVPSTDPTLGPNEITALNAIGYDVTTETSVPEPSSLVIILPALLGLLWLRRPIRGAVGAGYQI
jgi:hypothetical protein